VISLVFLPFGSGLFHLALLCFASFSRGCKLGLALGFAGLFVGFGFYNDRNVTYCISTLDILFCLRSVGPPTDISHVYSTSTYPLDVGCREECVLFLSHTFSTFFSSFFLLGGRRFTIATGYPYYSYIEQVT